MATEKRKIHRVIDAAGTLVQVLPETSAEQVTLADAAGNFTSNNVEGALAEVAEIAKSGGVTGVKGDAETTYRKGNVNITKANIGLGNVDNTADANKSVKYATEAGKATNDAAGNKITDTYATKNELRDGLAGKASTKTYENYQAFVTAMGLLPKSELKVGDNIYIKKLDVPDMWVTAVNATSATYTYTNDQAIINALDTTNGLTVGYFSFSKLETEKVDLASYQTKNDNSLVTTDKTVVGAINEVYGLANEAGQQASANTNTLDDIINNGAQKVKKAEHADTADTATSATNATTATSVKERLTIRTSYENGQNLDLTFDGSVAKLLQLSGDDFVGTGTGAGTSARNITLKNVMGTGELNTKTDYTAFRADYKGRITAVGHSQEFGTSGQTTPSDKLMMNGIFWELQ